jgi:hypothetical protein
MGSEERSGEGEVVEDKVMPGSGHYDKESEKKYEAGILNDRREDNDNGTQAYTSIPTSSTPSRSSMLGPLVR